MSTYGPPKPDEDMITLIHLAVDNGVTFLDTSDIYGPFTNEILLGKVVLLYYSQMGHSVFGIVSIHFQ